MKHTTHKSSKSGKEQTIARKAARADKRRAAAPLTADVYRFRSELYRAGENFGQDATSANNTSGA